MIYFGPLWGPFLGVVFSTLCLVSAISDYRAWKRSNA